MKNYFRLEDGRNQIRIMSKPELHMIHFGVISGKKTCTGYQCDICKTKKELPKQRVSFDVLDRKDGEFKRLEVGPAIYSQIRDLIAYNHIMVETNDIIINRSTDAGSRFPHYNVMPGPHSFLTPEEQTRYDEYLGKSEKTVDKPNNDDICSKCGANGTVKGMACICDSCGNIIWGI